LKILFSANFWIVLPSRSFKKRLTRATVAISKLTVELALNPRGDCWVEDFNSEPKSNGGTTLTRTFGIGLPAWSFTTTLKKKGSCVGGGAVPWSQAMETLIRKQRMRLNGRRVMTD